MDIKDVLKAHNFRFKKVLGQNFITDVNLLTAIADDAEITADDTVVEIGTGAGSLTRVLASKAKKVYTFEVDTSLEPILKETLADFDNIEVNFLDILKAKDSALLDIIKTPFKVVANLPYFITTPLLMRFIESELPVVSITIMVQKEVAERLCATYDTADYGAITASLQMRGVAKITRIVSKKLFYPIPNVDSAVLNVVIDDNRFDIPHPKLLKKVIKTAFHMRRKTMVNNIVAIFNLQKEDAQDIINSLGFQQTVRGEALSLPDLIRLSNALFDKQNVSIDSK